MKTNTKVTTQAKKKKNGFTLIEVIAVLVLLGILAAVAVPKYVDMSASAKERAIDGAISELNGREALTWGKDVISTYVDDAATFAAVDKVLGGEYDVSGLDATGGNIIFQGTTVALTRTASTADSPGSWTR